MTADWAGLAPSPTPSCTRAICSTRTARPRVGTDHVGSGAFWALPAQPTPESARTTVSRRSFSSTECHAITLVVRFLQLQHRRTERDTGGGRFEAVDELIHANRFVAHVGRSDRM